MIDPTTGEVRAAKRFVAVLNASKYTYAETSLHSSHCPYVVSSPLGISFYIHVPSRYPSISGCGSKHSGRPPGGVKRGAWIGS
jgi:hypothetical protein